MQIVCRYTNNLKILTARPNKDRINKDIKHHLYGVVKV